MSAAVVCLPICSLLIHVLWFLQNVADSMREDGLAVVVVNCDDGVPRLSRVNVLKLAIEVRR